MRRKLVGTIITFMFLVLLPCIVAFGASSPVCSIQVKELTDNKIQADVKLTNAEDIYGAQIYINFNKDSLNAVEILKGNIIIDGDPSVRLIQEKMDNENGYAVYAITKIGTNTKNISDGTLFSIIFDKKQSANMGLYIGSKSVVSDENGNNIGVLQDNGVNDATLKDIRIGGKTISNFNSNIASYTVEKSSALNINPKITAIPTNEKASVLVKEDQVNKNIVRITVKSENQLTTKEYVINFTSKIIVQNLTVVNAFNAGVDTKITVKVTNNSINSADVTLLTAIFDNEGKLVTYTATKQSISSGKNSEITAMLGAENLKKGYLVRYFVFDSFDRMYPYSKVVEIPVQ